MRTYQDDPMYHEDDLPLSVCERRDQSRRAPSQTHTYLWVEGQSVKADVIDVSDSGIGLLIPDRPFSIGPHVQVDYEGDRRMGIVAYLNRREDGNYRLGIEWIQLAST